MAIIYMKKLEEDPASYDTRFTVLTQGRNLQVNEWILSRVQDTDQILEVGCGPGTLARSMAVTGAQVTAIDQNDAMIVTAKNTPSSPLNLQFYSDHAIHGNWTTDSTKKYDLIVSTFLLSELRPLEQQIFLRHAWNALAPHGRLIIAEEFTPHGIWKLGFKAKHWWYRKKLKQIRPGEPHPMTWFDRYPTPIGFSIDAQHQWDHGTIRVLEYHKTGSHPLEDTTSAPTPGYYQPPLRTFTGVKSWLRIARCVLTGQVDHAPIEPGIYPVGSPTAASPVLVTANYDYTYIRVMRDLQGINAWLLCVDSRGINVWCAARGNNFGNPQVQEAVTASGIHHRSHTTTLILPQLAAGGVAVPQLPTGTPAFPYQIKFGPIWSRDLPAYLATSPSPKPPAMRLARFTASHRLRAGITHTTFLLRKVFLIPLLITLALSPWIGVGPWLLGTILLTNTLLTAFFPVADFSPAFLNKSLFFGALNLAVLGSTTWLLTGAGLFTLLTSLFYFWIAFFCTMSFSGYTMATSPSTITQEYPAFSLLNKVLGLPAIVLAAIAFLL